jgi:3-deoxy-D-manno-octulosonic-acid transferase
MMYYIYDLFLFIWMACMLPFFMYRAFRFGKYLDRLPQRFGSLPENLRSDGRPTFWFHSCSVGETLSVQPLVQELRLRFPDARFVFSTITATGQAIAKKRFEEHGHGRAFYLPVDFSPVCRRFLDWIRPTVIVIIDTEIWPNLLHSAKRRGIPVIMANGRLSPKSFRQYRLIRPFLRKIFENYRIMMMQSIDDAERIRSIGAPSDKVIVSGNIKYDKETVELGLLDETAQAVDESLGLTSGEGAVIVAGSTHEGEEQVLLEVLRRIRLKPHLANTRLLLVPRHPERFDSVTDLAVRAGFPVRRRSEKGKERRDAQVMVLDSIGELGSTYRFATIAFVGGTLIPHGGQSIIEPAWYARPIVVGPSMENFRQIASDFMENRAMLQIKATSPGTQVEELTDAFVSLLEDEEKRNALGQAGYLVSERSRGAARFTVDKISLIFNEACKR